jgi:hypothetical protein
VPDRRHDGKKPLMKTKPVLTAAELDPMLAAAQTNRRCSG